MIPRAIALLLCLLCAGEAQALTQPELETFAAKARLEFAVLSNLANTGPKARLILDNQSDQALPAGAGDWRIYFHSIRRIADLKAQGLELSHVQGDLHRIRPNQAFEGLAPGEKLAMTYSPSAHLVSYTDFMPRAFIQLGDGEPRVFANTDTETLSEFVHPFERPEQWRRNSDDQVPKMTPERRYRDNQRLAGIEVSERDLSRRVVPRPAEVTPRRGSLSFDTGWSIHYAGRLATEAAYLQNRLTRVLGAEPQKQLLSELEDGGEDRIILRVDAADPDMPEPPGSYRMELEKNRIHLIGRDNTGAFYALQTLLGLLPARVEDAYTLPRLRIRDWPRAQWRGMHYDMARNFHGKAVTLRLIEQMARYKLNRLHLHLSDDEGWRLEIAGLPELTDIGGQRCFDPSEQNCLLTQLGTGPHPEGSGNGFYSSQDFVEILRYAAERHITVIPEIDLPGHARAAVKAMEARSRRLREEGRTQAAETYRLSHPKDRSGYLSVQNYTDNAVDVCLESSYAFVDKVLYELQNLYRQAGLTLDIFHFGGDEVATGAWVGSPACQTLFTGELGVAGPEDLKPYFVARVAQIAEERGLSLAGWEDGLMYDARQPFERSRFGDKPVIANAWDNIWEWGLGDRAYRLANAGYQVVISHATHLYFDHPYEPHPKERGYYWATRATDTEKVFGFMPDHLYANARTQRNGAPIEDLEALLGRPLTPLKQPDNILGIQGQVWSETLRTAEQLEAMVYPRLLALAERAWHRAEWESAQPDKDVRLRDFIEFSGLLVSREMARLAQADVALHLRPPGARLDDRGRVHANSHIPGLGIEYSQNGVDWRSYEGPLAHKGRNLWLRHSEQGYRSRAIKVQP